MLGHVNVDYLFFKLCARPVFQFLSNGKFRDSCILGSLHVHDGCHNELSMGCGILPVGPAVLTSVQVYLSLPFTNLLVLILRN